MSAETMLKRLEATINKVCADIRKRGAGADKLDSLSKLVNSYSRLLERKRAAELDHLEHGDPSYHDRLLRE